MIAISINSGRSEFGDGPKHGWKAYACSAADRKFLLAYGAQVDDLCDLDSKGDRVPVLSRNGIRVALQSEREELKRMAAAGLSLPRVEVEGCMLKRGKLVFHEGEPLEVVSSARGPAQGDLFAPEELPFNLYSESRVDAAPLLEREIRRREELERQESLTFGGAVVEVERERMTVEEARRVLLEDESKQELPILDTPALAAQFMRVRCAKLEVEKFFVLSLNRKNRLIAVDEATSGTVSGTLVHPREVFRHAILRGASAVICVHNHPSGDPAPSAADIKVTRQLREAAAAIQINLLDHVIRGDVKSDPRGMGYYSFQESGLL